MKRLLLLPNLITAFSLSCGLFIIFRIILFNETSLSYSVFEASTILLLVAAIADVCDGAVARILKAESEFGIQFDSLADCVTFGVAPSVIILKSFSIPSDSGLFFLLAGSGILYSLCGVLRLARFNVAAIKKREMVPQKKDKKIFTGLPIPAAAIALVSCNLFLISQDFAFLERLSQKTRAVIMIFVMIAIGYFMVSRWKFPSLKTLHFRVKSFSLVFITSILAVVLLWGILHLFAFVLFVIAWAYLVPAWIIALVRALLGRKNQA